MTELIKCSFGLNKTSCRVLLKMLKIGRSVSVEQISKKMGADRTTVQKALKTLINKNLVSRKQMNLENGGYIYLYKTMEKQEIKRRMTKDIDSWTESAKREVDSW